MKLEMSEVEDLCRALVIDGMEITLIRSGSEAHSKIEEYRHYVTVLESKNASFRELKEAVETVENGALCAGYSFRGEHPEGYWYVWDADTKTDTKEASTGSGNSIPAAVADYKAKNANSSEVRDE